MRRQIYTQGDLDGACFLYAIANAYTALTHRTPELEAWDKGIRAIPHAIDFLQSGVGTTQDYAKDRALIKQTVRTMLAAICGNGSTLRVDACPQVSDLRSVAQLVGEHSVAFLWYQGGTRHVTVGDHWVCAVAVDDRPLKVYVACSMRRSDDGHLNDREYTEKHHADTNRYSNDSITEEHESEIIPGSVFKISTSE